jgi:hypothetical protein
VVQAGPELTELLVGRGLMLMQPEQRAVAERETAW